MAFKWGYPACESLEPNIRHAGFTRSQAKSNTVSVIHRLNPGSSMNCLKSSVSSFMRDVMTLRSTLSCSMRALASSEFCRAFPERSIRGHPGRGWSS